MKSILLFLSLFFSMVIMAQSKNEIALLSATRDLHLAVFQNKDSAALERLFASELTYGHSNGRIENREEALRNLVNNTSVYQDLSMDAVHVQVNRRTAVTRHVMTANEKKADGTISPLKLHILLVWTKEGKDWRIVSRQAVKLQ